MEKKPTLWTKNFTILSLGTVVSTLGNAVSGFAICLLVLDYTGSTLLYAVFNVVYNPVSYTHLTLPTKHPV